MSKATKRKHVTKEVLDEFILPTEGQQIVRVYSFFLVFYEGKTQLSIRLLY